MSARGGMADRLEMAAIAGVGGGLVTALLRSANIEVVEGHRVEAEIMLPRVPVVYVLWHGRLLPCSFHYRRLRLGTLITRNRDGDYIARVVERWGYRVIRGSSSRGGASALRSIVRMLRGGTPVALTPDGPRGPRQKMKLGPLRAAQLAGVPIVPVTAGATRAWYFGRWDRFLVPKPFTWMPLAIGEPTQVPPRADEAELTSIATALEDQLNRLTELVDEAARAGRR